MTEATIPDVKAQLVAAREERDRALADLAAAAAPQVERMRQKLVAESEAEHRKTVEKFRRQLAKLGELVSALQRDRDALEAHGAQQWEGRVLAAEAARDRATGELQQAETRRRKAQEWVSALLVPLREAQAALERAGVPVPPEGYGDPVGGLRLGPDITSAIVDAFERGRARVPTGPQG